MEIQTRPQTEGKSNPSVARKTNTRRRAKPPASPKRSLRARAIRYLEDYEAWTRLASAEEDRRREEEARSYPLALEHFYGLLRRYLSVKPQECERAMMDEDTFYAEVEGLRFSASRFNSQGLLWHHIQCDVCGKHDRSPVLGLLSLGMGLTEPSLCYACAEKRDRLAERDERTVH
jgi:hypothetical protein